MSTIDISIRGGRAHFLPGESIEGSASWNLGEPPQAVEVRLVWFTSGKGSSDVDIVATLPASSRYAMGDTAYRFLLPEGPHSFSGGLISLNWAVEAVAFGPRQKVIASSRADFTLSPDGREIQLPRLENEDIHPAVSKFLQRKAEAAARRSGR